MNTLLQDFRFGLRILAKNPGFTIVAVLTLALGIGANTAIFNVLDAVLLRVLPVKSPSQLVLLTDPDSHGRSYGEDYGGNRSLLTFTEFQYLHDHNDVFSGIFAADSESPKQAVMIGNSPGASADASETERVQLVSGDYFSTLGVGAAIGRTFTSEVDRARGASPVAVISHAYWRERFDLDPAILGKSIRIHQTSFEIIGVAAPGFNGITVGESPAIWIPLMMQDAVYPGLDMLTAAPALANQYMWLHVMARLKPGMTVSQSRAAINVAFRNYLTGSLGSSGSPKDRSDYLNQQINVVPGSRGSSLLHEVFGNPLKVLMGIAAFVLLIACANVANLLLARGTARQKEFAVRMAVGAGRRRLARQLLMESFLLATGGAALGVVVAQWVDRLLARQIGGFDLGTESAQLAVGVDARTLAFTLAIAALTTALFGVIPALRGTYLEVSPVLKSASDARTGGASRHFLSTGKSLVIAQVAISMVLLVAAGLFIHSLERLSESGLGFNRDRLLLFRLDAAPGGYNGAAFIRMGQDLLARISAIPGVRSATLSSNGLFQNSDSGDPIAVEGYTVKAGDELHSRMDHIGPGYFSTVGIPLLRGREIGLQDSTPALRTAVVNTAFVRQYFPRTDPLGKHLWDTFPGNPGEMQIVGVVGDSKFHSLRETIRPRIFIPIFNPLWDHQTVSFEIRAGGDAESISKSLRRIVQETNPAFSPIEISTMSGLVDRSLGMDRLITALASCFGGLALLLAAVGLYGVMSYAVGRRTSEIGLRMALGAQRRDVLRLVLGHGSALVLTGVGIGMLGALVLIRFISSMLFGVKALDPVTYFVVSMILVAVALVASFIPARRAMKVDPIIALRYE